LSLYVEKFLLPGVKIEKDYVEIGEEGNLCRLTTGEWKH